jgi:hypothetical protein
LEKAIKYAHSCGITGVHTDDRGELAEYADLWELYTKVTESHPIRVQLHYHIHSPQALKEFIGIKGELPCTDLVTSGAAKLFLDGSLGARTAALLEDYSDDPGKTEFKWPCTLSATPLWTKPCGCSGMCGEDCGLGGSDTVWFTARSPGRLSGNRLSPWG